MVVANEKVKNDRGKVAIERGPIVYCAEWPDNDFDIAGVVIQKNAVISDGISTDSKLKGLHELSLPAQSISRKADGKLGIRDVTLRMIPYYSWANRGEGKMRVWIPTELSSINNE